MKQMFVVFAMLICVVVTAQKTYTVKAGEDVKDVIPMKEIYLYDNFIQGTVFFKEGTVVPGKLNYKSLIGEIQFIDPKGDTLALANEETVSLITILKDTFYFDGAYVRLIQSNEDMKLGERVEFREFVQKPGAYGLSSSTTATDNFEQLLNRRAISLNTSPELVIVKNTYYLIGDRFNHFVIADKKNILGLFPKKRKKIEEYLKGNDVNYNKKEDLVKLLASL